VREALAIARAQLDDIDFLQAKVWFPAALPDMNTYCLGWRKRPDYMNDRPMRRDLVPGLVRARAPELASAAG
jgi:hypothetical protein